MTDPVRSLMDKARQALDDAHLLAAHHRVEAVINRVYYAAFHAARAALLTLGETPKSHKGVRTRFDYHFIETGRLAREVGQVLNISENARRSADYDALTVFDTHAAADLIADVETFVQAVEVRISSTPDEAPPDAAA